MKKRTNLRKHSDIPRAQGVALIMAILITSLVSIAAVAMITQQQLDIRRTQNILHFDQAYLYVLGAEEWAKGYLGKDESKEYDFYPMAEEVDVIGWPIAEDVKQSGIDIGGINGIITDATAGFPLNNLVDANGVKDPDYVEVFEQLVLATLEFKPDFHNLVLDWIDKDDNVSTGGAESLDYLNLPNRPYLAANQAIASVSELRLVLATADDPKNAPNDYAALVRPNFDPMTVSSREDIERQPLVNALPRGAKININTAPKAVLKALMDYVGLQDSQKAVDEFDEKRGEKPQNKIDEFIGPLNKYVDGLKPKDPAPNSPEQLKYVAAQKRRDRVKADMIDVKSEYFYLTANSQIGDVNVTLISLLHRDKDDKVTTLRRGLGVI
ncbi:MAG: type II secretion system minor pseudopilin GspK [Gammaproteobacteria bacterium]|jgi:general secretion pathway protein K